MFQQLDSEAHQLLGNGPHWGMVTDALYPCHHVTNPRFQRRRQPALATRTILTPRGAVAGLALAPSAANSTPLQQAIMDLLPTVPHLAGPHYLTRGISQQGESGDRAAGVNLEAQRL